MMEAYECSWCSHGDNLWNDIRIILTYDGSVTTILLNYFMLAINLMYCTLVTTSIIGSSGWIPRCGFRIAALVGVFVFQIGLCIVQGCVGISIVWCAMAGWLWRERRSQTYLDTVADENSHSASLVHHQDFFSDGDDNTCNDNGASSVTGPSSSVQNEVGGGNDEYIREESKENEHTHDNNDENNTHSEHPIITLLPESTTTTNRHPRFLAAIPVLFLLNTVVILYYLVTLPFLTTVAHACALLLGCILSMLEDVVLFRLCP